MKTNNYSSVPSLLVEETTHCRHYMGSKEELIRAGIALEFMFPAAPKRKCYFWLDGEDRHISKEQAHGNMDAWQTPNQPRHCITRTLKQGKFRIEIRKRYSDIRSAQNYANRVKSAEEFKSLVGGSMDQVLAIVRASVAGEFEKNVEGFQFTQKDKMLALIDQLMSLISASGVKTSGKERKLKLVK